MPQSFIITGNIEFQGDREPREGRVEAYDRDLPSLEQRGAAPQLLGQSPIDGNFNFRIEFTDEQFRRGEGEISFLRRAVKISPDLSFRIFDASGRELKIARIVTPNREYGPDQIIFNAPPTLEGVTLAIEPAPEVGDSEYERLVAAIAPVLEDLPIAELTDEDIRFLVNELGLEQQLEAENRIKWLRHSALLARETNLPIEAFYGWGRKNVPADFAELTGVPLADLPSVLRKLIALETDELSRALLEAIAENIIPANLRDQIDEIMAQIERLKVGQGLLTARRFIGKLLNERSGEPLVGFSVQGFDLDAGQEPKDLGQNVSNNEGVFALSYITPSTPAGANPTRRRLRLQVLINPQTQEKFETEVQAGGDQDILDIPVPIPAPPEPESHQLTNLIPTLPIELSPDLLPFLADKNISSLADIRKAGGISRLEGLPIAADDPSIRLLEAHADLSRVSLDVQVNAEMIENRYDSVAAIAQASRPDFVSAIRDRIGDFKAAQLQVAARAQTHFLDNVMFDMAANQANGFEANPMMAANQVNRLEANLMMAEQIRCRCRDCEAAVSPLAYLADLLKYATENLKNSNVAISAADLATIFHQPFDLPASCEAVDTQIRQVRLCIEVLRSFLGARPLADAEKEANLADAEKDYLLAAYTALLTKIGTNYAELRLSRTNEPTLRQSLADRLGIDLSHLNALFLDPATLTEAKLEQLFGLVDTTRDPLAPAAPAELQTWRLEYLRTLWKSQDLPTDGYEDGQNVVTLKQLPAGVTFAPPLDTKISYDPARQQLVYQGEMTADERSTLLALSPDLPYQQAVKQLFQMSQRLPIIDPDLIGPDDFRRPFLGDPDQAFDLWKKRRDWVDDRLQAFSILTKVVPSQPEPVPDIAAMLTAMYQPVTYGTTSVITWANTTPSNEFETLRNQLTQGIDVNATKFKLQEDLNMTVEDFTRLMAIAAKAQAWENDTRSEKVNDDEWREVHSILVQAQKIKLFATWRKEESDAGIQLDPQTFWISLRQPQEGEWTPSLPAQLLPLIDPATLKLKDLPEPIVGERAIAFWQARQTRLEQIPKDLAAERQTNGFDAMLKLAIGHPDPGNPLQHDLTTLKTELSNPDPAVIASATTKIINDLHLTLDSFKRLLAIKAKHDDPDPAKKPTAAEWAELYAILTPARKIKHEFPVWINEEENPLTGVFYWNALKAKLPRWRSSGEARQLWQQALRNHSQSAIIDPDLIGPGDLKKAAPGDPAFDLWKAREGEISTQLAQLAAAPKTLVGLDTIFQSILGISVAQFLAIAADQEKGNAVSDRLAQLSLEVAEFNYLLRVARLANQTQPILDLEWENVYSILVQVWKRQQSAQWREAEKTQNILLSSDFFQIPSPTPIQVPSKEPKVADIWRSPRITFQDWQDKLQSRLDQEQTTIQALAEAVSAAEEATLPMLRDALIFATKTPGDFETKAKWVTQNLLIDAKMSSCSMTTRVAQAIETLQGLVEALRTGQLEDLYLTFTLNLDNFDEKWKWLGSYVPWRAAIFVWCYTENLCQPSLRKWQTPAFKTLLIDTQNRKLTSNDACLEAKKYAEYYQDICTLNVEASCTSRTRLTKNDGCNQTVKGYRCLFYMFGRGGLTGKVYWSVYDFQEGSGYAQTFWDTLKVDKLPVKDFDNIIEILGAVPYEVSPDQRFIFLFAKRQVEQSETLVCAKYDLENKQWLGEALKLAVPDNASRFKAVVKQVDYEDEPPHLAFRDRSAAVQYKKIIYKERKLNNSGTGWESDDFYPIFGSIYRAGTPVSMIAKGKNAFFIFHREKGSLIYCTAEKYVNPPPPGELDRYQIRTDYIRTGLTEGTPSYGAQGYYRGAFLWPNIDGIFLLTEDSSSGLAGSPLQYLTPPKYRLQLLFEGSDYAFPLYLRTEVGQTSPFPDRPGHHWFSSRSASWSLIPTSGVSEDGTNKTKRLLFDSYVAEVHQLVRFGGKFTVEDIKPVMPNDLAGPYEVPIRLSEGDLQIRRNWMEGLYQTNSALGASVFTYFAEAYYFVPVHLALALHRSGDYVAALDLLRTVYDYTAEVTKRKIYHGLVAEELLSNTYKRSQDWLLDPLNPHQIAVTRQNTYTRFTLQTIILCLLDYANAEFTQDTPESNPRARRLCLTVLDLLDTQELKQSLNQCEKIIGVLDDIPIPDERWQIKFQQIKGELEAIPDPQKLQPVVEQIGQALIADAPLEQRFVDARGILNQAIAALPPAPTLTTVIQENENFSHAVQRSLLSDSSLATALESISTLATDDFQRTVSMVTGISPARLELRPVDLPWLREPIPLTVNPEEARPGANLAIARRDVAQLDVLAPTYMARLAEVAALDPMNAVNLAVQHQEVYIPRLIVGFCIPPNPLLKTLRLRAELNLYKLRTCRNIAGLKRQLEPYAAPTDTTSGLPSIGAGGQLLLPGVVRLQPTLYRYQVLIERTKQLVQIAGQIEAEFLAALEKRDRAIYDKAYSLLKARQDLGLAQAGVQFQNLRITEATNGVTLAGLQKKRSEDQLRAYQNWIEAGLNEYEQQMITAYNEIESAKKDALNYDNIIKIAQAAIAAAGAGFGAAIAAASLAALTSGVGSVSSEREKEFQAEKRSQVASVNASFERRKQEWELQQLLATNDIAIGEQQIILANDRVEIVTQEKAIAELQTRNAKDIIEFLGIKQFTDSELYDWMSGVLEGVYRFFLQQATAMAKLSENQLAFERQEVPPAYIQANYWNVPSDSAIGSNPNTPAPDRKGLTGSARLLQDIYQLDQYAFNTNQRKLQLARTFSLALLAPEEFQRFRETGVMNFATPMELFDRGFPGHYLRLIRRVRTSVIALIPPIQGIHATLTSTGLSRTVIGPDIFQTVPIRRDPEFVALTSPANSTGMFELEPQQPDMLLPFEGNGVDSNWEFLMPKAANQFDYRTIADVLITIEYTALNSFDYRQQVIQTLNPNLSADRPFSFRNQFADQWYDLHNPDQTKNPMKVKFQTFREDFPPNVETLKIQQVLLYVVRASQKTFELPITELRFTEQGNQGTVGGSATPIDGIISTRRGNGGSWTAMIGKTPVGDWELTLPSTEEVRNRFKDEEIDDILFVITYSGRTPEWPM